MCSLANGSDSSPKKPSEFTLRNIRRVAVVGAGPSGISLTKSLVGEDCFDQIDVFEQQSSFGGAWVWSQPQSDDRSDVPQTNPFGPLDKVKFEPEGDDCVPRVLTPMYDKLETNIPHILMTFSDKSFPPDSVLFPDRTSVLKYIEEYGEDIKHLVKFGHQVTKIELYQTSDRADLWTLTYQNLKTGQARQEQYDAVVLASGHLSHTSVPDTAGIREWNAAYPGSIRHSKFYRSPEEFAGKKVIVVGNASSGIDVGSQIARTCQKPVIMSARSEPLFDMPSDAEHINVPDIVEFVSPKMGNRAVKFADGTLVDGIDVVLYCTGYFMSFPFLEERVQREMINTGFMVHGLYQHIFWIQHPSLAFIGLPVKILPMPLGEAQASVLSRVWSGRLTLPTQPQMRVWEHERWCQVVDMLKSKGKPCETSHVEKAFSVMGSGQDMEYHNAMVTWASQAKPEKGRPLPHIWSPREIWLRSQMAKIRQVYFDLGDKRYDFRTVEELGFDYEKYKGENGYK